MTEVRRVDVGGGHVHVEIDGAETDPPVVLLHGFAASTFTWRELAPSLAATHRVVSIDRLGFGRSDRVVGGGYSFDDSVRHTIAVLDAVDVAGDATFIGHSAGAGIAAGVALASPDRAGRLVLIAPAIVGAGPPPLVRRAFALPGARRIAPAVLRAATPLLARSLARTWADGRRVTPDVVSGYLQPLRRPGTAEALVEMTLGEPGAPDLLDDLPRIDAPALVIVGSRDRVVREGDARTVAGAFDAEVVVIDDAGHLPHEEQPAATFAAIEAFLDSASSR